MTSPLTDLVLLVGRLTRELFLLPNFEKRLELGRLCALVHLDHLHVFRVVALLNERLQQEHGLNFRSIDNHTHESVSRT